MTESGPAGGNRLRYACLAASVAAWLCLAVAFGQVGPDEADLVLKARSLWSGEALPLVGLQSTRGFFHGPWAVYLLALTYGAAGFHLGIATLLNGALWLLGCFALALGANDAEQGRWSLLLALTSPALLASGFTSLLHDNPYLLPFSAFTVAAALRNRSHRPAAEFLVGLLLGICLGIHAQAIPFALAVIAWRAIVIRRARPMLALAAGCLVTTMPYLLGVLRAWHDARIIAPNPMAAAPTSTADLVVGLFRYWGASTFFRIHQTGPLVGIESAAIVASSIVVLAAYAAFVVTAARPGRVRPSWAGSYGIVAMTAACCLPFAAITRTGAAAYDRCIWWTAPLLLPAIARRVFPSRARASQCLSVLVGINLGVVALQVGPRLIHGYNFVQAGEWKRQQNNVTPLPAWWDQMSAVRDLCRGVNGLKDGDVALVKTADVAFIGVTIPRLVELSDPQCASRIKWARPEQNSVDFLVRPDTRPARLVVDRRSSSAWFDSAWAHRKLVRITNPGPAITQQQIPVDINTHLLFASAKLSGDCRDVVVTDVGGGALPVWLDPSQCPGSALQPSTVIWTVVALLPPGDSDLFVYYGSGRVPPARDGGRVFDFFDDFQAPAAHAWELVSGTRWKQGAGVFVNADRGTDTSALRVLAQGFLMEDGAVDAKLRLRGAPLESADAGVAFGMVDAYNGYAARVQSDGTLSLRRVTDGVSSHIAYVPGSVPAPSEWHVLTATRRGAALQVFLDGHSVIDTADRSYSGAGRIGMYKDRGAPGVAVEFDWLRVRKIAQRPVTVALPGPEESRR